MQKTIQQLMEEGIDILGEREFTNPILDAQLLLCYVLNVDKIYLYTHKDQDVAPEDVDKYQKFLVKRKQGYPLQYILGKQEFMGLDFSVGGGVLVPRPDTEILVQSVLDFFKDQGRQAERGIKIVDIGTGSGAIALSLAHYIEGASVYAVDISDKALAIAIKNCEALALNSRVQFLLGDVLEPLQGLKLDDDIDVVVSNPPYIPSKAIDDLQIEVASYEPRGALDGGEDGLDYYRRISQDAWPYLKPGGLLAFEIGYNQGEDVKDLMQKDGYRAVEVIQDLAGKDRVVLGRR